MPNQLWKWVVNQLRVWWRARSCTQPGSEVSICPSPRAQNDRTSTGITQFLTKILEMLYSTLLSGGSHSGYEGKQMFAHFTRLIEKII